MCLLGLCAAACTEVLTVFPDTGVADAAPPDAGPGEDAGVAIDAAPDPGSDAGEWGEPWPSCPPSMGEHPLAEELTMQFYAEARTGDACSFTHTCHYDVLPRAVLDLHPDATSLAVGCVDGTLSITAYTSDCSEPWDSWNPEGGPWLPEECALNSGGPTANGEYCGGGRMCVRPTEDACCYEVAKCSGFRGRACRIGCPRALAGGRMRTECPLYPSELVEGESCVGTWSCADLFDGVHYACADGAVRALYVPGVYECYGR